MSRPASAVRELLALALPAHCASCGLPDEAVCSLCHAEVQASVWAEGPREVSPDPRPRGLPRTYAAGRYEGALASLATAYKDDGRRDLRNLLAALLGPAVEAAVAASPVARAVLRRRNGPVLLVPVPSSRASQRRRGDAPLVAVARRSVQGWAARELLCADVLRQRRRVADQAGLSARARALNLEYAMRVRPAWEEAVRGSVCVVVDDVLTTGATLVEARRALVAAGAREVIAATVCATQRRARTR